MAVERYFISYKPGKPKRKIRELMDEGFFLGDGIEVDNKGVEIRGRIVNGKRTFISYEDITTNWIDVTSVNGLTPQEEVYAYLLSGKFLCEYKLKSVEYMNNENSVKKSLRYSITKIMKVLNDAEVPITSKIRLLGKTELINGLGWSHDDIQKFIRNNTKDLLIKKCGALSIV